MTADVSVSYQLNPEKVPEFYVRFRNDDLKTFTHGYLRSLARDKFNEVAATYAVEDIYGPKKEVFLAEVKRRINDALKPVGAARLAVPAAVVRLVDDEAVPAQLLTSTR